MDDCIFCKIASGEIQGLRIYEDNETLAFMDIAKDVDGHIHIIPRKKDDGIDAWPKFEGAKEDIQAVFEKVKVKE